MRKSESDQPDAGDYQRRFADTCESDGSFINPASDFQIAEFQLGGRHASAPPPA